MGKVWSSYSKSAVRFVKNYNVENRAFKKLDKDLKKPAQMAPRHETEKKLIDEIKIEHPEIAGEVISKNLVLDDHLKKVRVHSSGTNPEVRPLSYVQQHSLPQSRSQPLEDDQSLGYVEPPVDRIPAGRLTLLQAIHLLTEHQKNKSKTRLAQLVQDTKLTYDQAEQLTRWCGVFVEQKVPEVLSASQVEMRRLHADPRETNILDRSEAVIEHRMLRDAVEAEEKAMGMSGVPIGTRNLTKFRRKEGFDDENTTKRLN